MFRVWLLAPTSDLIFNLMERRLCLMKSSTLFVMYMFCLSLIVSEFIYFRFPPCPTPPKALATISLTLAFGGFTVFSSGTYVPVIIPFNRVYTVFITQKRRKCCL